MQEFSIRNKRTTPIVTLKKNVLQALLLARPESSSLVLAKYFQDYRRLTGKPIHLDHQQEQQFLQRYGARSDKSWDSSFSNISLPWAAVRSNFVAGFMGRPSTPGLLQDLEVAEAFYQILERHGIGLL